jgi:hypothetical protein
MGEVMKAGRELDALVAEKVMGWQRITGPKTDYDGPCEYGDVLIPPTISEDEAFRMMPPKGAIPFYYFVNRNWSTNISDAWQVQEKSIACTMFRDTDGYEVDLVYKRSQGWIRGVAETAPLAICLAALKAVGYEIEKGS